MLLRKCAPFKELVMKSGEWKVGRCISLPFLIIDLAHEEFFKSCSMFSPFPVQILLFFVKVSPYLAQAWRAIRSSHLTNHVQTSTLLHPVNQTRLIALHYPFRWEILPTSTSICTTSSVISPEKGKKLDSKRHWRRDGFKAGPARNCDSFSSVLN